MIFLFGVDLLTIFKSKLDLRRIKLIVSMIRFVILKMGKIEAGEHSPTMDHLNIGVSIS